MQLSNEANEFIVQFVGDALRWHCGDRPDAPLYKELDNLELIVPENGGVSLADSVVDVICETVALRLKGDINGCTTNNAVAHRFCQDEDLRSQP